PGHCCCDREAVERAAPCVTSSVTVTCLSWAAAASERGSTPSRRPPDQSARASASSSARTAFAEKCARPDGTIAGMPEVQVAHTADLDAGTLEAGRALLYDVFDDMTDGDWEHSLGGMHALAWHDGQLIGHASVIQRRLLHAGRA